MAIKLSMMGSMAAMMQAADDPRPMEEVVEEALNFFTRVVNYAGPDMVAKATNDGLTLEEWEQVKSDYEQGVQW